MKGVLIRHEQSTGNVGIPCTDLATIELTEKGWSEARGVTADWTEAACLM